mgnify:CR=1 FL=1
MLVRVGTCKNCIETDSCQSAEAAASETGNKVISNTIKILWDGEVALVVHKPAGIATQAADGIDSLETRLRHQLADRIDYLAFPHRLDRPVSGVVLVATRKRAAKLLSEQFASRKVGKLYLATVTGKVSPQLLGNWVDHLRKVAGKSHAEIVAPTDSGARLAETHAQLRRYDSSTDRSLLELAPLTGRMHQLRVQTAHRGHPIVGDWQYGGIQLSDAAIIPPEQGLETSDPAHSGHLTKSPVPESTVPESAVSGTPAHQPPRRILLQAHKITFHDPRNGVQQTVTASDEPDQSV